MKASQEKIFPYIDFDFWQNIFVSSLKKIKNMKKKVRIEFEYKNNLYIEFEFFSFVSMVTMGIYEKKICSFSKLH